jgi:hypothetical protein
MTPRLIGLYSPRPGCGKTTIANMLVEKYGYVRMSYARVLKDMLKPLVESLVHDPEVADNHMTIGKEWIIPSIGLTSRFLQQKLGTEYGRDTIAYDLWVHCLENQFQRCGLQRPDDVRIVVDDLRFENEYRHLRHHNALLIKVNGDFPGIYRNEGIRVTRPLTETARLIAQRLWSYAPKYWRREIRMILSNRSHFSNALLEDKVFDEVINNDTTYFELEKKLEQALLNVNTHPKATVLF